MYNSLRNQFLFIILFIGKLNVKTIAQTLSDDSSGQVPEDFVGFLQGLGSMVYTHTKPPIPERHRTTRHHVNTTPKQYYSPKKTTENVNTQKAALRDALMLKLISYYEDKYSLSHHEPVTIIPTEEVVPATKRVHIEIVEAPQRRPTVQFYNMHNRYQDSGVVVI